MMDQQTLEGDFYDYLQANEEISSAWNHAVLAYYLDFFVPGQRVLDVGCGSGQFIEQLLEKGCVASGVDVDARMVEYSHSKGLSVEKADLFTYLSDQCAQFDGVFSSNMIEHLTASEALRFIQLSYAALKPGGVLVVATPNPESLIVHLYEFWRDATHVRLYSAALLEFMLCTSGFRNIESGGNPHTIWTPAPEFSQLPELWGIPSHMELAAAVDKPWQSVLDAVIPDAVNASWRRRLRRRLARFLIQTVMFEDFKSLIDGLHMLDTDLRQLRQITEQAIAPLHASQSALLTIPREVFAVGYKSTGETD